MSCQDVQHHHKVTEQQVELRIAQFADINMDMVILGVQIHIQVIIRIIQVGLTVDHLVIQVERVEVQNLDGHPEVQLCGIHHLK